MRLTNHAESKLGPVGATIEQVTDAVLDGHRRRQRNAKDADWLVTAGRLVVAYDWPDHADRTTARVVTLWRR